MIDISLFIRKSTKQSVSTMPTSLIIMIRLTKEKKKNHKQKSKLSKKNGISSFASKTNQPISATDVVLSKSELEKKYHMKLIKNKRNMIDHNCNTCISRRQDFKSSARTLRLTKDLKAKLSDHTTQTTLTKSAYPGLEMGWLVAESAFVYKS